MMIRSLKTAATGMEAQQLHIDVIANNISNVNTVGFKKGRAEFQDLFYQEVRAARRSEVAEAEGAPAPLEVGQGTRPIATTKVFTTGSFKQTGNDLDVAIEGEGFLRVQRPDGTYAYTRDGQLKIDADGQVVNAEGRPLDPPVVVPPETTQLIVERDGTMKVMLPEETLPMEVGQLELSRFVNPAGLKSLGHNLYEETEASGIPFHGMPGEEGLGTVTQGALESSNVEVVQEMIDLISAQRAYEINSRVVRAADEMLQQTAALR
ncbi:MAG: flagellar basal-body rod protein FlgG [Myxococcota bacterium]